MNNPNSKPFLNSRLNFGLSLLAIHFALSGAGARAATPTRIIDNPPVIAESQHENPIVAVIDTGVDYTHSSLATSIWQARTHDEIQFTGWPAKDQVTEPTLMGWDFRDNDPFPYDLVISPRDVRNHTGWSTPQRLSLGWIDTILNQFTSGGHGTHVAGIIKDVAVNVEIMPLRVDFRSEHFLIQSAAAVEFAAKNGAKIINMSFGFYRDEVHSPAIYEIDFLARTMERYPEVLFVIAAGNENRDMVRERKPLLPAGLPLHNILVVGAVNETGELARFSNIGEGLVDLYAPGVDINSTWPRNQFQTKSGTSMATPFVVGAAARLLKPDVNIGGAALKSLVLQYARTQTTVFKTKLPQRRGTPLSNLFFETQTFVPRMIQIPVLLRGDLPPLM